MTFNYACCAKLRDIECDADHCLVAPEVKVGLSLLTWAAHKIRWYRGYKHELYKIL